MDEDPPNDRLREDEAELRLLQRSMEQSAELEAMARALKVLHSEAVQRFRSHLADQLQNLRDESIQPIDPEDPRWSELVEVATELQTGVDMPPAPERQGMYTRQRFPPQMQSFLSNSATR